MPSLGAPLNNTGLKFDSLEWRKININNENYERRFNYISSSS